MIRTLTLNPAVDKTVFIDRFLVGEVNRMGTHRQDAGGKGLNVARVLRHWGADVLAVAPAGGPGGEFLRDRLNAEGLAHRMVGISGATRTNLKIVDKVLNTHTDLNEQGPALAADELERVACAFFDGVQAGDWLVFSGSLPPGVPKTLYADWISRARSLGARTALDADGEAFAAGLRSGPDLVKPNRAELEAWVGRTVTNRQELFDAVDQLRASGARDVAVSLGEQGAWLFQGREGWYGEGLKVPVASTVGAGDALLAGLLLGLSQALEPEQTLARAVAIATASVIQQGTGGGEPEAANPFVPRVNVSRHGFETPNASVS